MDYSISFAKQGRISIVSMVQTELESELCFLFARIYLLPLKIFFKNVWQEKKLKFDPRLEITN
jgi:hypothetical protein